ncbi:MAG: hypothetical protein ACI9S8_002792 [Chlamydiales bacterium]|jgi:uncharacterized protein (DUF1499 family)
MFNTIFGSSSVPLTLGVHNNRLAPCPDTPNCVSSQSEDSPHYITPLFNRHFSEPIQTLRSIVDKYPRVKVLTQNETYLHVEFCSFLWGFTDDVEFYYSQSEEVVHVRSAARVGYKDFGTNRRRMEAIRANFNEVHNP